MADAVGRLPTYRPQPGRYDELADEHGHVREDWEGLVRVFDRLGPSELDERRRMADRLLVGEGAGYVVQDDDQDPSLPVQIDPVPLLWRPADWAVLEAGLAQRAHLLDAVLADLYGEQRLLRTGVVPAELVLASPAFRWPAVGVVPVAGPRLTVYAADIVREVSGRLVVLRDHTDAPSGAGYALVNRRVLSRLFPDMYRDLRVERHAAFFTELRAALAALAPPDRISPRSVVLTPGVGHPSYFEHTYLASYLGYHLVEGADLAVRGGRLWLRALAGLEPVDVVLRRVEDGAADPLELGGAGGGGVAGLLEAAREGGLGVANALGSGVAGDVALQAYLPDACELLLGERLRLPSVPTLWLGDPGHRSEALAHLDDMVLHETTPDGVNTVFASRLSEAERTRWLAAIDEQPGRFVAQPKLRLATAPVLEDRAVVPGTVVVRAQAVAAGDRWSVLPGGVGRVVSDDAPALDQRGGTAKDVWVLAGDRTSQLRAWSAVAPAVPQVDLRTSLPSRVAEALFWVGRNAERAEATARLALALLHRYEQSPELVDVAEGAWLDRAVAGLRAVTGAKAGEEATAGSRAELGPDAFVRAELTGALGEHPQALARSLAHVARSAGSVREYLSSDTWRVVGTLDARRLGLAGDAAKADLYVVAESLHDVVLALMALSGLTNESVVRGPGWRFLDLGRRLERALRLLGLVEAMLVPATPAAALQPVGETVLAASESLVAYRRRYRSDLELEPLCDLLLGDDSNPRSLAFQIDRMAEDLASLPDRRERRHQQDLVEQAGRQVIGAAWLDEGRPTSSAPHAGLQQFVLDLRGGLLQLSESVVGTWFAHLGEARLVWRGMP